MKSLVNLCSLFLCLFTLYIGWASVNPHSKCANMHFGFPCACADLHLILLPNTSPLVVVFLCACADLQYVVEKDFCKVDPLL